MTTDERINNPTQRLYDLLSLAKSKAGTGAVREIWAQIFGVNPNDTIAIFYNLVLLYQAFQWTERQRVIQPVSHLVQKLHRRAP